MHGQPHIKFTNEQFLGFATIAFSERCDAKMYVIVNIYFL